MSITDGQIVLRETHDADQLPSLDVAASLSRMGIRAYHPALQQLAPQVCRFQVLTGYLAFRNFQSAELLLRLGLLLSERNIAQHSCGPHSCGPHVRRVMHLPATTSYWLALSCILPQQSALGHCTALTVLMLCRCGWSSIK